MAKRTTTRKRNPVRKYGQFILGGNLVQDANKVLCLVSMATIPNQDFSIERHYAFQDYRQFIDLCDQIIFEDREKMSEFYLHNLALIDLNVWDPNLKLGDLQLMALASWMNHEEVRAIEMKKVMEIEETKPLMIRAEQSNPMAVINTHNLISNDPKLAPKEQAVTHFEDMFKLLGDDSMKACQRRWNTLPYNLKSKSTIFLRE